jgi:O-methyltransferase involved in polyketide biosynthesis
VFAVDENPLANSPMTFVPTQFACETLAAALEKSDFSRLKASLFVWLGGAGYRTLEGVFASLAFIASLPKGSGVVFDYMVERTSSWELAQNDRGRPICANGELTHTALDGLASRILVAGGNFKYLIQPQAVAAMLRGLGFRQIVDLAEDETATIGGRLVSAVV